ncbi:hypothetical protein Tsubulata_001563, partial [Turnera subulata]
PHSSSPHFSLFSLLLSSSSSLFAPVSGEASTLSLLHSPMPSHRSLHFLSFFCFLPSSSIPSPSSSSYSSFPVAGGQARPSSTLCPPVPTSPSFFFQHPHRIHPSLLEIKNPQIQIVKP